jgi:hypothetical protein
MTPEQLELETFLAEATEDELGVALFTGKLTQLIAAGADFGITAEHLHMLLVAINVAYDNFTAPPEGLPN